MAIVNGTEGADHLNGSPLDDTISGFGGADRILTGDGADRVDGGDGDDEVNGYLVDAASGEYAYWPVGGPKQIVGGAGDDFLVGGSDADTLDGGSGADRLYGQAGDDVLDGGAGDDQLYDQGGGADTLRGGDGHDLLSTQGSADGDWLDGGAGDDALYGGSGADTLDGGSGRDVLQGGGGDDVYWVRDATDRVLDSGGDDTVHVAVSGYKRPDGVEHLVYLDGVQPLPYWLDALVSASGSGLHARTLLGAERSLGYAFPDALPAYDDQPADALGFLPFTDAQAARAREALAGLSGLVDLRFVEVAEPDAPNTISFANNRQAQSDGYAWYPSANPIGSDVFLNRDEPDNLTMADGSPALLTLAHELGHALGLKHPFAAGGEPPYLGSAEDSTAWTVMSYQATADAFALRWSPLDIAALQYLYGPSPDARAGDDRYRLSESAPNLLWDGGGHDLIDASAASQGVTLHLDPGWWDGVGATRADRITAPGQVTVNFGTAIEDLLGSDHGDALFGNALANRLDGGAGDDTLQGGAGDDRLDGGAGSDTAVYAGVRADYLLALDAASGLLSVSARLGDEGTDRLSGIETLRFADVALDLGFLDAGRLQVQAVQQGSGAALPGVALQVGAPDLGVLATASTGADGRAALDALPATAVVVAASLPVAGAAAQAAADAAVDLQDAVAILRMVVGLGVDASGAPASGLQARAADFDGDGRVGLGDALGVLRHVVGLDGAAPQWRFVDATDPALAAPGGLTPGALPTLAADLSDPAAPASLQLLGVLAGDVDASLVWPTDPRFAGP